MERTEYSSENPMSQVNDMNMFQDFIDETEFEQFIAVIRGESAEPIVKFCGNYECEHINGCNFGENEMQYVNNNGIGTETCDPNIWNSFMEGEEEEDVTKGGDEEENSSETVNTVKRRGRGSGGEKGDRSRTLISERRRRSRMKEKLYALRALVPNITKMDKASIVGDAALYVQELQMQAKKLRTDVATLEASSSTTGVANNPCQSSEQIGLINSFPTPKKIAKMDVFQVEERGFYVRAECNTGQGVAVSLYKALESFTSFDVQSSNLATVADNFVLTFTLNVKGCGLDMNLPNLKLWVAGAFLNQGFHFNTFPSA